MRTYFPYNFVNTFLVRVIYHLIFYKTRKYIKKIYFDKDEQMNGKIHYPSQILLIRDSNNEHNRKYNSHFYLKLNIIIIIKEENF